MLNTIIEILATVIDTVFLIWFIPRFNHTTFLENKWTLSLPIASCVFQLIVDRLQGNFDLIFVIIQFIIFLAYSFLTCKKRYPRAILAACLYTVTIISIGSILSYIIAYLSPELNFLFVGDNSNSRIIFLTICKLMQYLTYRVILHIFRAGNNLDTQSSVWCVLFTLFSIISLTTLLWIYVYLKTDMIYAHIFVIVISIILSNVIFYLTIYHIQKLLKLKYELKLAKERMEFEAEKTKEAHIIWDNIRKVRHDIQNHLIIISNKIESGNAEQCLEYIKKIGPTIENMGNLIRTNNPVIDYLINSKLSKLNDVQVKISGYIGNLSDIEETDLTCIMGNILDNAIEAQKNVESNKRIELYFQNKNGNRIIICKNSISQSVLKNNIYLTSTKKDSINHGLGHRIVESSAKKYGGMVDYFEEENLFGVQIILPNNKPN